MYKKLLKAFITIILIGGLAYSGVNAATYILRGDIEPLDEQNLGATVLSVQRGGTGAQSFTSGECLVGNGTGAITTQACGSGAGGSSIWSTTTPGLLYYNGSSVLVVGNNATSSDVKFSVLDSSTDGYFYAGNGGSEGLIIDENGNVGIATSVPAYTLDVNGDLRADNINFDTGTSTDTLFINQICNTAGECFDSPSIEGSAITFYPSHADADIATYETLLTIPASGVSIDESCSADADVAGGYCLIDSYISTTTDINILNYPAGTTNIHAYSYVSSPVGNSYLVFTGYRRESDGTEHFIGQATSSVINALTVQEYIANFTGTSDTAFNPDGTDRLVLKVYGYTTSNQGKDIHWQYQSTGLYSHFVTPITTADRGFARIYADETITGNWTLSGNFVNTAHPWADNEVSDTLTVTGYMQDEDINTFSELNTWVTDATLLKSGGTLTSGKLCTYDGAGIDCNSDATTDDLNEGTSNLYFTNQRIADYLNASSTIPDTSYIWQPASNGDILYYNSGWKKLSKGIDGQCLVLDGGLPAWGNCTVTQSATSTGQQWFDWDTQWKDIQLQWKDL